MTAGLMGKCALAYAERCEWAVLPCKGKVPIVSHGVHDASKDPAQVAEWWRKYPEANIGKAEGAISGTVALDVDAHKGGEESLEALVAVHGPLPETVEQITGRGGRHIIFQHPGWRVKNISDSPDSPSPLGPALDVRGDGGYIIIAPSVHPETGRRYAWEGAHRPLEVPIAPLPEWLAVMLKERPETEKKALSPEVFLNLMRNPVLAGSRRPALIRLAGHLLRKDVFVEEVVELLLAWNRVRCSPALPDDDVIKHVNGIAAKEDERRGRRA